MSMLQEWLMFTKARRVARRIRAETRNQPRCRHNVYVVLLRGFGKEGNEIGFYVGQSVYVPDERFRQHKADIRAAGVVRRRGERLLPKLYQHLNPLSAKEAKEIEAELAEAFREAGLPNVRGGH